MQSECREGLSWRRKLGDYGGACHSGRTVADGSLYKLLDNSSGDLHLVVSATDADLSTRYFREWENKCWSVYRSWVVYEDQNILIKYHKAFQFWV